MPNNPILKIALPTPLRRCFDYLLPAELNGITPAPGCRVAVPFGNRNLVGIIVDIADDSSLPVNKLKQAIEIIDEQPLIPDQMLKLYHWCAQYYQHSLGEVFAAALPAPLRKGKIDCKRHEVFYALSDTGKAVNEQELKRAPRQAEIMSLAGQHPEGVSEHALKTLGLRGSPLKSLLDKGWVVARTNPLNTPILHGEILAEAPLSLNQAQQQALEQVLTSLKRFNCFLLEGITGSGKTEVYLHIIERVLQRGASALVLVPEIGLTPQTLARFKHRFNVPVSLLHSGRSDQERAHDWMSAADTESRIVIGTRSSVFTPIHNLGVIIVDEEHDLSFKQQDGLRYSARDLAVMRAHQTDIPIVLGTATPSLESLYNVQQGRYRHLVMPQRAGEAEPPVFELLDIRSRPLQDGFSQPLVSAISEQLSQGNQVLIFLNRRGFAPTLMCHQCGWMANCERCDTRYTLHLQPRQLRCHHCDAQRPTPQKCPDCDHGDLNALGVGTERSEQAISMLFPDTPVIRIDRDTTRTKSAMEKLVAQIHEGRPCILVGTQMLAKGHHFPDVTLVAILEADAGLFSSDFRGLERMGQLITQVSGRAGRAEKKGKVLIQTHQADHPLLNQLISRGYSEFAQQLLVERAQTELPPYRHAVLIRAEAVREQEPYDFLEQVRQMAESIIAQHELNDLEVLGPVPAVMYKRAGRYRAQLMLQCDQRKSLHNLVSPLCLALENLKAARRVRWSVDVDPMDCF